MPEGPEIRRARDRIAAVIEGRCLRDVELPYPAISHRRAVLEGARVVAVESRGKAMLIRFDNHLTLYSHNQLYGVWRTAKNGVPPSIRRTLRVALFTDAGAAFLYSATDVELCDADDLAAHEYLRKLGPDVLDAETTPRVISGVLRSAPFRRRGLGGLLLNQSCLAGLGNYLRSEILFVARLHPNQRPGDLSPADRRRLIHAVKDVTVRAYERAGVTLDERGRKQAKELAERGRKRHYVFGRANRPCYRCRTKVEKIEKAGRRLYLCPVCQPAG